MLIMTVIKLKKNLVKIQSLDLSVLIWNLSVWPVP